MEMEQLIFEMAPFIGESTLMDWRKGTAVPSKEEIKEIRRKIPVSTTPIDINVLEIEDESYVVDAKFIVRG